jgi:hypothetical protein
MAWWEGAGAVGVVYSKDRHAQHLYNAHTDDVISLAIHPDQARLREY